MVSSSYVWMWELDYKESWALKNWCFSTVVLEKTLESPLDCRRSNQSILKEISSECSLEGLMLKLKLQYFGHLMQRTDSLEKALMLGKFEGVRRRGWQRMRWWMASLTRWTWVWVNSGSWWWAGRPGVLQSMGLQRVKDTTEQLNWTELWSWCAVLWWPVILAVFSCSNWPFVYILCRNVYSSHLPIIKLSCLSFCCLNYEFFVYSRY